jgi:hypothetical protein
MEGLGTASHGQQMLPQLAYLTRWYNSTLHKSHSSGSGYEEAILVDCAALVVQHAAPRCLPSNGQTRHRPAFTVPAL